jgi:hypothetical protein
MRFPYTPGTPVTAGDKRQAAEFIRMRGTNKRPDPPRSLQAQSARAGILITWEFPAAFKDIAGWNIYKGTESQKQDGLKDPNTRQYFMPSSSGATPPIVNVFISAVNALGAESQKVQIQGKALVEVGAPANPNPPAGSSSSGDAGANGASDGSTGFPSNANPGSGTRL